MTSNKQNVEKINAAFEQANTEAFLSHCKDDVEWTMVGQRPMKGKDSIRKWMSSQPPVVPQFTVSKIVAEGDFAACYGDMIMTEEGKRQPYSYCDLYRFENGKVAEMRSFVLKNEYQPAIKGA